MSFDWSRHKDSAQTEIPGRGMLVVYWNEDEDLLEFCLDRPVSITVMQTNPLSGQLQQMWISVRYSWYFLSDSGMTEPVTKQINFKKEVDADGVRDAVLDQVEKEAFSPFERLALDLLN